MLTVRRFEPADTPQVWALSHIPNIGATADRDAPVPLPSDAAPPPQFDLLTNVQKSIVSAGGDLIVGCEGENVVAMGAIIPYDPDRAEVKHIRVHPARRRRGYGHTIMDALETRAGALGYTETYLDTATNQPEAVSFYRQLGYREIGRETRPEWNWTLIYFVKTISPRP